MDAVEEAPPQQTEEASSRPTEGVTSRPTEGVNQIPTTDVTPQQDAARDILPLASEELQEEHHSPLLSEENDDEEDKEEEGPVPTTSTPNSSSKRRRRKNSRHDWINLIFEEDVSYALPPNEAFLVESDLTTKSNDLTKQFDVLHSFKRDDHDKDTRFCSES